MDSQPLLIMEGIGKRFGATVALQDVHFAVAVGEIHALVGENGAGKSTLMKILSGALRPDHGQMRLGGEPYQPRHPLEARRAGVAMIYQELSLAPHLSVADNILLGIEPTRAGFVCRRAGLQRVREALALLGHEEIPPEAIVGCLSPAAQQITEIARALVSGCRVLVLDEPTSSLTQPDVERLFALLKRLRAQGLAIVYISHFIEEVKRLADRVTVLRDGRVVGGGAAATMSLEEIIRLMVGREISTLYRRSPRQPGEVLLEIDRLAGRPLPVEATLQLRRGEIVGVAGLVGSGRTELVRTIFGLQPIRAGKIRVGAYWGPASPQQRWQQGCGYVSEDRAGEGLALRLSLTDNIVLPRLESFFLSPRQLHAAAREWVTRLQIRCHTVTQPVGTLSGGNQQKVALARLLHQQADLWLLDEPTRGIDVGSKAELYRLIDARARGAAGEKPAAILLISSYLPELFGLCDRIAVMRRGRLSPARPVQAWTEEEILRYAMGQEEPNAGGA